MKKIQHQIQSSNEKLMQLYSETAASVLIKYKLKLEKFGFVNGLNYSNSGIIYTIYKTKTTFVAIISEK